MKTQLTRTPREIRRLSGLNQQEFWSRIGVTQSGGSRYENDRNMPRPVRTLLNVVHVHQIDLGLITSANAAAVRALLAGHLDVSELMECQLAANRLEQRAREFDREASQLLGRIRGETDGTEADRVLAANCLEQQAHDFDHDANQLLGRIRGASIGMELGRAE